MTWRCGDALILAEGSAEREELLEYFGDGDRLPMLLNFLLNQRQLLAMARCDATPIVSALEAAPVIPDSCQWATFLRNHDEVDLGRLSEREREVCFAAFGPDEAMQLYGRGIRRRLAPMLAGDHRRIEMAYSLAVHPPPGRPCCATGRSSAWATTSRSTDAMPSARRCSGRAAPTPDLHRPPEAFRRPVISGGSFGYETVNVEAQRRDPGSLLRWMESMLRETPGA